MSEPVNVGDYVLATKYKDGDPCDHFCIGFVSEIDDRLGTRRFMVVDDVGKSFRANGFRRAERITGAEGQDLLSIFPMIGDKPGPSLWEHLAIIRDQQQ